MRRCASGASGAFLPPIGSPLSIARRKRVLPSTAESSTAHQTPKRQNKNPTAARNRGTASLYPRPHGAAGDTP
jgi:hypothetical protein